MTSRGYKYRGHAVSFFVGLVWLSACSNAEGRTETSGEDGGADTRDLGSLGDLGLGPDAELPACSAPPETTAISPTIIPYSEPDLIAPARGGEQWHWVEESRIDLPVEGTPPAPLDRYFRIRWDDLERANGSYNWGYFDLFVNEGIDMGQKTNFGIVTACSSCKEGDSTYYDGGYSSYPLYLHELMQAEDVKDWRSGDVWFPAWNSPSYLSRFEALLRAVNEHMSTTTHNGILQRDAIGYIDVRGYGNWGEWHVAGIADRVADQPAGVPATTATLKRIVDAYVAGFPDHQLVAMICGFDGNRQDNIMVDPEVGYHLLTVENNFGPLGWRRDNWADSDGLYARLLVNNMTTYNGLVFSDAIMSRWQTSRIVGEASAYATGTPCDYDTLEAEVRQYHASSFGNAMWHNSGQTCVRDNIRAASKAAGYRLQFSGGSVNSTVRAGGWFTVALDWQNVGVAPTYEPWEAALELRNASGEVVMSAVSSFRPRLFLPSATPTRITDTLVVPAGTPAGSYELALVVRDPTGVRLPLPLAVRDRRTDGSYLLAQLTVEPCP